MTAGVAIGTVPPGVTDILRTMEFGEGSQINAPIAVLIWLMSHPMRLTIDFSSVLGVRKRPKGILITLFVNWLAKHFSMTLIAYLFFKQIFFPLIGDPLAGGYLFHRFEKAGRLRDLVSVLKTQHARGHMLTGQRLSVSSRKPLLNATDRHTLSRNVEQFVRMDRPHEARGDMVLFPAVHELVATDEYDSPGEECEEEAEHGLFPKNGFAGVTGRVALIEKPLARGDLSNFPPE